MPSCAPAFVAAGQAPSSFRPPSKPCTAKPTRSNRPTGPRSSLSTITCSRSCPQPWSRSIGPSPSPRSRVQMLHSRLDAIAPDLENYHLLHAARGTMLRRLGRREAAQAAFERAADLAATEVDRRFLAQQIEELASLSPTVAHDT